MAKMIYGFFSVFVGGGMFAFITLSANMFADPAHQATMNAQGMQTAMLADEQQATLIVMQETVINIDILQEQHMELSTETARLRATVDSAAPVTIATTPPPDMRGKAGVNTSSAADPNADSAQRIPDVQYLDIQTASDIQESDGCALDRQEVFPIAGPDDPTRIYLTFRGMNIRAGTEYQTRWLYEGETRHESITWAPESNHAMLCIYFWLESSYTPFADGMWTVQLLADNMPVGQARFRMCEGDMC